MTFSSMSRKLGTYILFGIFRGILCLIETSQLILACKFAFALPDFCLEEFSDHNKNDLFAIFQSKLIKKQIFLN